MTEPSDQPYKMQLRIPPGMHLRLEQEKARRLKEGGSARPEATSIILDALNAYLLSAEKKATASTKLQGQ